jgi:hypothetical protein
MIGRDLSSGRKQDGTIDVIADEYRRDGYTVAVRPRARLATILEIPDVDLIATRSSSMPSGS